MFITHFLTLENHFKNRTYISTYMWDCVVYRLTRNAKAWKGSVFVFVQSQLSICFPLWRLPLGVVGDEPLNGVKVTLLHTGRSFLVIVSRPCFCASSVKSTHPHPHHGEPHNQNSWWRANERCIRTWRRDEASRSSAACLRDRGSGGEGGQGTKKVDNELQKGGKWVTRKKAAMVQKYWTSDKKWARQTHQIQFLVLW